MADIPKFEIEPQPQKSKVRLWFSIWRCMFGLILLVGVSIPTVYRNHQAFKVTERAGEWRDAAVFLIMEDRSLEPAAELLWDHANELLVDANAKLPKDRQHVIISWDDLGKERVH